MLGVKNGTNLSKAYIVQNKWVDTTTYFLWIFFLKSSFVKLGIWVVLGSCNLDLIWKGGIRVFSNHENPHQQTCWKQSRLRESSSTPQTLFLTGAGQTKIPKSCWVVVSNIFYVHPHLGNIAKLTNIFQGGWNHQLAWDLLFVTDSKSTGCF